jgi:hypothetical protein
VPTLASLPLNRKQCTFGSVVNTKDCQIVSSSRDTGSRETIRIAARVLRLETLATKNQIVSSVARQCHCHETAGCLVMSAGFERRYGRAPAFVARLAIATSSLATMKQVRTSVPRRFGSMASKTFELRSPGDLVQWRRKRRAPVTSGVTLRWHGAC